MDIVAQVGQGGRLLPYPRHQRIVQRVAPVEHLLDRDHADALGAAGEQPVGEVGGFRARAMQRDEALRVGLLPQRGNGGEGGAGLLE